MCGLTGILNLNGPAPISEDLLRRMTGILRHRGPDECGIFLDPRAGLGHVRLSIVGLDDGIQPMGSGDGRLWIAYNGEAFNYPELRQDLERRGHRFTTGTDTEVVLHLYEEFGPACLERINGQFALAIWDAQRREMFLARDRVGIRPLYYTQTAGQLLFASEIKALLLHPGVRRAIDLDALSQVFTFWTTLSPRTLFQGIQELPPGHFLRVREGRLDLQRWWELPWRPAEEEWSGSFDQAREELEALLTDAVRLRLRADVPVGAYLSGGLDSSILSSLAAEARGGDLRTYSLGFADRAFDETPFQEEMARLLGTDHRHLPVTAADIRAHLPATVWHCEKPLLRTAPVPLYLLSRLVRDSGLKVVLTGEGADEVFAGYNIFKEAKVRRFWSRRPDSRLRPRLLERLYPYIFTQAARERHFLHRFYAPRPGEMDDPCFSHRIRWENGLRQRLFLAPEAAAAVAPNELLSRLAMQLPPGFAGRDDLARAQWLEMSIFLADYLLSSQGDRVAMAHSLELRHPFLDYRVIEFAAALPARCKLRGLNEKYILKKAFGHRLPPSILHRSKQPYRAPIAEIFAADRKEESLTDHLLTEDALRRSGLFHPERVAGLLARFRTNRGWQPSEGQNMAVTGIATAQLLHHQFVEGSWLQQVVPAEPQRVVCRQEEWREPLGRPTVHGRWLRHDSV